MGRPRAFKLSEREQQALTQAERNCTNGATRTRYQAVGLYGSGYSMPDVQNITGCSVRSVLAWSACFRDAGIAGAGLVDTRAGGNRAKLSSEQIERVHAALHRYTPDQKWDVGHSVGGQFWTVADVRRLVKDECNVVFDSTTSYRALLDKCDMSYQKTQGVYKNRSAQHVAEFHEQLEKNCSTSRNAHSPR
jgi:transposase